MAVLPTPGSPMITSADAGHHEASWSLNREPPAQSKALNGKSFVESPGCSSTGAPGSGSPGGSLHLLVLLGYAGLVRLHHREPD